MDTPIPVLANPHDLFRTWFAQAQQLGMTYPNSISLATIGEDGHPDVRIVLLKGHDDRGFVFYTNFQGAKGRQLLAHPAAAICFWWEPLGQQVRARGPVRPVTEEEADAYFASRPRLSQIGAWASNQSSEITGRQALMDRVQQIEEQYKEKAVPRPPHWSGFRLMPQEIEFWKEGEFRLHDRLVYSADGQGGWKTKWLAP